MHSHNDSVVKIKSLPFDATQLDIIQFFEGFRLKPNGVQLVVRSDNKPTGEVRSCDGLRRRGWRLHAVGTHRSACARMEWCRTLVE